MLNKANADWSAPGTGCQARVKETIAIIIKPLKKFTILQITACNSGGTNAVCSAAQIFCNDNILTPLARNFDVRFFTSKYLFLDF